MYSSILLESKCHKVVRLSVPLTFHKEIAPKTKKLHDGFINFYLYVDPHISIVILL